MTTNKHLIGLWTIRIKLIEAAYKMLGSTEALKLFHENITDYALSDPETMEELLLTSEEGLFDGNQKMASFEGYTSHGVHPLLAGLVSKEPLACTCDCGCQMTVARTNAAKCSDCERGDHP